MNKRLNFLNINKLQNSKTAVLKNRNTQKPQYSNNHNTHKQECSKTEVLKNRSTKKL